MNDISEIIQVFWNKFETLFDELESIEERLSNLEQYIILKEEDEHGWNDGTLKELRKAIEEQQNG